MIKHLTINDTLQLMEIEQFDSTTFSLDQITDMLNNKNYFNIGYFLGDTLVSFLFATKTNKEIDIIKIMTAQDYRQKGYAINLLEYLLQQNNHCLICLEVNETNQPAINLYHKLGFKQIGVRKKYYQNIYDALVMTKSNTSQN